MSTDDLRRVSVVLYVALQLRHIDRLPVAELHCRQNCRLTGPVQ